MTVDLSASERDHFIVHSRILTQLIQRTSSMVILLLETKRLRIMWFLCYYWDIYFTFIQVWCRKINFQSKNTASISIVHSE